MLEGIARAKQDRSCDQGGAFPVLPVLLHGDAAFAGQGVVAETLQCRQLRGYRTGGTIHIIVNNQVGFTTAPTESRTSMYCTDVARMIQAPIFHVNGDDPEACIRIARLAFEFRQEFNKDVVLDLICYRRRGHNEGDDPSFTQPRMYDLIEKKRSVRKLYTEALIGRGDITVEDAEAVHDQVPATAGERVQGGPRPRGEGEGRGPEPGAGLPGQGGRHARHRDHRRDAEEDRRRAHHLPGGLHRAPQGDAPAAAPGRGDHPGPDRLGHRGDRWPSGRCCSRGVRSG